MIVQTHWSAASLTYWAYEFVFSESSMFTLLKFILHLELHAKVQEQFQRRYRDTHLNKVAVSRVFTDFRETWNVPDKKKLDSSVLTAEKFEDVLWNSLQGQVSENLHHRYRCPTPVPRELSENFVFVGSILGMS